MASPTPPRYEVEVTVSLARDLKNVNWRNGDLRPYAVLWIDDGPKSSTRVASTGDPTCPLFDEKVTVPFPFSDRRIDDSVLHLDVVHARSESDVAEVKPLVGSATIPLRDVIDEVGLGGGGKLDRTLRLKRPSGRPQGKVEVRIAIKEPQRYYDRYSSGPAPYPQSAREAYPYGGQPPAYGGGYGGAYGAPPSGYPYGGPPPPVAYGGPPPPVAYGGAPPPVAYGGPPAPVAYGGGTAGPAYGYGEEKKKKSGMGLGTGLAVGAVAGVLGGLAIAEGVDYVEDKIEDKVTERVEDDLAYDEGGYDDDY